ncbi:MAG: amidase [Alphaproteobacteria bacterium]|nr:amidase [Alphaproteobacteria bacterium]
MAARIDDPYGAFCTDTDAYLEGAAEGPLAGLTFAAKDIFDVAGHTTGGGNPDWKASQAPAAKTAPHVQRLVDAGATMAGKTITDEITRGILGENAHYGTPVNPRAPGRVPGGSSSGSASAVAGGLVDFALGSDTGGSVRVPASFCGLYGMRTTHGRLTLDGMLMQARSFDTVGWFARDAEMFAKVAAVMFETDIPNAKPTRMIVADDAFEVADSAVREALEGPMEAVGDLIGDVTTMRLSDVGLDEWRAYQQPLQSREAWETAHEWVDRCNPRFGYDVARRLVEAAEVTDETIATAQAGREAVQARMAELLGPGTVVCLPTAPFPAPEAGQPQSQMWDRRSRIITLTCVAGLLGAPQMSLPLAEVEGVPIGLSLLAAPGEDEMLTGFARDAFA